MRRLSLVSMTLGALFGLACMCGGDETFDETDYGTADGDIVDEAWEVTLSDPWSGMNLPVGSGMVFVSDPTMLLISYDGDQVSSLGSSYDAAVQASGWALAQDMSTPEFKALVYTKGSDAVGLGVGAEEGMTFVYLEFMEGMGTGDTVDTTNSKITRGDGEKPIFMRDGAGKIGKGGRVGGGRGKSSKGGKGGKIKAR